MSEQHGRKRDAWKLPGEGTGVYGVDPLVFLNPGDNAEVDELLEELRTDCDEGDPFFVDFRKRKGKLNAPANTQGGEGASREAREERGKARAAKRKGGVSPRWLGYATVAIVGPAVTLLLVLLLSSRKPVTSEAPGEPASEVVRAGEGLAAGRDPGAIELSEAAAAPSGSPLMPSAAAPTAGVDPSSTTTGAPAASGLRVSPARARVRKEEDPYDMPPVAVPSASPSSPPRPSAAPPEPPAAANAGTIPEESVLKNDPAVEKPEAEF
jgi:hypothetical protein